MKYVIFSFTKKAALLSSKIHTNALIQQHNCVSYTTIKSELPDYIEPLQLPLKDQVKEIFHDVDAIIFVSACAIAVRTIAPYLESKTTDPAVIVIDELGHYAISLLSGHIGGGNEITKQVASWIGATPIISTATDLNRLFAVDVFATSNGLYIDNMQLAKEISSSLLDGNTIGFTCDYAITTPIPHHLQLFTKKVVDDSNSTSSSLPLGFTVSHSDSIMPFEKTLHLIPKVITLGIGCRRGTALELIERQVLDTLQSHNISIHAVTQVASIDLKADEEGLINFCSKYNLPFQTYTANELNSIEGEFTPSTFVQSVTGVDNVCERSAICSCPKGEFLIRKTASQGVTVAAVARNITIQFS